MKTAKTAILNFWVKKSKFWLLSPPEAPDTLEIDCNIPPWRPLNDLRWVWAFLFWPRTFFCIYILYSGDIGQLVKIYRGVQALTSKRLILGGVSFRVISSPMNAPSGNSFIGSWDQNCERQFLSVQFTKTPPHSTKAWAMAPSPMCKVVPC